MSEEKDAKPARRDPGRVEGEPDMFVLERVFPEATSAFSISTACLSEVRDSATVVVDTNSLLVPYSVGKKTLQEIGTTYKRLAKTQRLVVPARVAREFARNRSKKLAEIHQQLCKWQSGLPAVAHERYPLLDGIPEYDAMLKSEEGLDAAQVKYRNSITKVIDTLAAWEWNDPVTKLYRECLPADSIVDTAAKEEDVRRDFAYRMANGIPPGNKDQAKSDGGIGDYLIWLAILEVGRTRKQSVIFVSNDGKSDWWTRSENQHLYPRFELVDEFRRISGGRSFHILKFSEFLAAFGASGPVIEEVRKEEHEQLVAGPSVGMRRRRRATRRAEIAVRQWFIRRDLVLHTSTSGIGCDFVVHTKSQQLLAVEVIWSPELVTAAILHKIDLAIIKLSTVPMPSIAFIVTDSLESLRSIEKRLDQVHARVQFATGVLTPDGELHVSRPPTL